MVLPGFLSSRQDLIFGGIDAEQVFPRNFCLSICRFKAVPEMSFGGDLKTLGGQHAI
jgi:hypothetical protein